MARFPYSVSFLDVSASDEDQDREWVACLEIEATTSERAKHWGDTLAASYISRHESLRMTQSSIETPGSWDRSDRIAVPTIQFGYSPTDDEIGW